MNRYCIAGPGCVAQRGAEQAAPLDGPEPLCPACLEAAGRDIRLLALDYADLIGCLRPGRGGDLDTKISVGAPRSRPPIDLTVETTQRDILWSLQVWEAPVREAAGLSPERVHGVRDRWAVRTAVSVIAPRVRLLSTLPPTWGYADGLDAGPVERDGAYAVAQLRELHRRARRLLGLTRRVVHLPGECSGCGAWRLSRDDGSDTVYCALCLRRWTIDDYHRYVGLMMNDLPPIPRCRMRES